MTWTSREALAKLLHELSGGVAVVFANTHMLDEMVKEPGPLRDVITELKDGVDRLPDLLIRLRKL